MKSAEVVVVGAGVIGCSIAHHLAARGCRDVLVLDRAAGFGGGSTARATGGFRSQFGSSANIALSLLSRQKLLTFEQETGVDPGYRQHGYLFIARSMHVFEQLRIANALQHECGVAEARVVTAGEIRDINPAVHDDEIVGGTFCPTDGFIRPTEILRGYAETAQRNGVRFEFETEVSRLDSAGGRIESISTTRGPVACGSVVNAAGAWAGLLSSVPVSPLRRNVAPTVPTKALPDSMPMTIWADDGFHLRVRDGRVLLLWLDAAPSSFEAQVDDAWIRTIETKRNERLPILRTVAIDRTACWSGLYEMSPDRHAILGRSPDFENLFLADGSSGHGVMHSPALGQLLAEVILDEPTSIDIRPLRPSRFEEGDPIVSSELL